MTIRVKAELRLIAILLSRLILLLIGKILFLGLDRIEDLDKNEAVDAF